jgi:hypothetical protein
LGEVVAEVHVTRAHEGDRRTDARLLERAGQPGDQARGLEQREVVFEKVTGVGGVNLAQVPPAEPGVAGVHVRVVDLGDAGGGEVGARSSRS